MSLAAILSGAGSRALGVSFGEGLDRKRARNAGQGIAHRLDLMAAARGDCADFGIL
jgi:hypothetical protein